MKSQVLHTVWCHISCEAAGEFWHWSLSGVKGLIGGGWAESTFSPTHYFFKIESLTAMIVLSGHTQNNSYWSVEGHFKQSWLCVWFLSNSQNGHPGKPGIPSSNLQHSPTATTREVIRHLQDTLLCWIHQDVWPRIRLFPMCHVIHHLPHEMELFCLSQGGTFQLMFLLIMYNAHELFIVHDITVNCCWWNNAMEVFIGRTVSSRVHIPYQWPIGLYKIILLYGNWTTCILPIWIEICWKKLLTQMFCFTNHLKNFTKETIALSNRQYQKSYVLLGQ